MRSNSLAKLKPGDKIDPSLTLLSNIDPKNSDPVLLVWNHPHWCPMVCKVFGSPRRANREAAALSAFSHPNIVRSFGFKKPSYTLMEYLDGPNLSALISTKPNGRMSISDSIRIAIHIGSALQHIHSKGFIHMDVKPANVIVVHGKPVLFDFGSIRILGNRRPNRLDGTDAYMAPEELLRSKVDEKADIFSLGVTLFELLTGKLPFPEGKRLGQQAQIHLAPKRLSAYRKDAPQRLEQLVAACLAKDPQSRPSLPDLLPALNDLLRSGPRMWPQHFHPGIDVQKTRAAS